VVVGILDDVLLEVVGRIVVVVFGTLVVVGCTVVVVVGISDEVLMEESTGRQIVYRILGYNQWTAQFLSTFGTIRQLRLA